MKVLLVDDSPLVCERITTLLSDLAGVTIIGKAQNVQEATLAIGALTPEVVISDIQMPGGSGLDVLYASKQARPAPLVIILTNYTFPQYRERCLKGGADFFFDKSTEFDKVRAVLADLRHCFARSLKVIPTNGFPEGSLHAEKNERRPGGADHKDSAVSSRLSERPQSEAKWTDQQPPLFDSVPIGLYCSTLEGRLVAANAALVQLFGYPDRETLLATSATELYATPNTRRHWQTMLEREGVIQNFETQIRRYDGSIGWVRSTARAIRDAAGRIAFYEGSVEDITARQQTEEAQRESELQFRTIFEETAFGLAFLNMEGQVVESNPALRKMLGYSREELQGRIFTEFTHPDDIPSDVELYVDLIMGERDHYQLEKRYLHKSGRIVWGRLTASLVQSAKAPLRFVINMIEDITSYKQVEEKLRDSEEQYRTIVENTFDLICELDQEGRFIYLSPNYRDVLGYKPDEMIGQNAFETVHPDDLAAVLAQFDKPAGKVTFRTRHQDGGWRWLEGAGKVYYTPDQRFRGIVVSRDVTERKQAEDALREEARISAALARVSRELIAPLDISTLLSHLCQLTTEVLGCDCTQAILWQPEQAVYTPVTSYGDTAEQWEKLKVARVPREAVSEALAQLESSDVLQVITSTQSELLPAVILQQVSVKAALWIALRQGNEIIGALSAGYRQGAEAFTPTQERLARRIAHLASLSLAKAQLFEDLERANQLKSDFLATMSHELRTPLNIIMGYTELLVGGEFGPLTEQQITSLQKVNKSANELLVIVTATLNASQLAVRQMPVSKEIVNLVDLLEELKEETIKWSGPTELRFHWRIAAPLPIVRTDRAKVKIVVKNLLSNAVKFTKQGSVTVEARPQKDGVEISVTDTGIGIAPEIHSVIFDLFRQGDSSMTRSYGGVGLGLYIVQRMLELLGGTIEVDSEVGKGSTFRVWIPLQ